MFRYLSLTELFELKLVSKRFHELVNSDFNFNKKSELADSICKQGQWSEIIQENLSYFKQTVSSEFEDNPMIQLYIKYNYSIFNGMSLYHIFCHFAFCKRSCDSGIEFC